MSAPKPIIYPVAQCLTLARAWRPNRYFTNERLRLPFDVSTPVTARLVPAATEDALALLLDNGVAAARASASLLAVNRHDASRRRMIPEDRGSRSKASIEEPTTDSDACQTCTGDVDTCERETESRAEGIPRWHLWYRGKVRYRICRGKRYRGRVSASA